MTLLECSSVESVTEIVKNTELLDNDIFIYIIHSGDTFYIEFDEDDEKYVPLIRAWEKVVYKGKVSKFKPSVLRDYL